MPLCKFFASGTCIFGASCKFIHELDKGTEQHLATTTTALPDIGKLNVNPAEAPSRAGILKQAQAQTCHFFLQGKCNKGENCRYVHNPQVLSPDHGYAAASFQKATDTVPDSRSKVLCRYISTSRGCQKSLCPYLHVVDEHIKEKSGDQYWEENEHEDQEIEDNFVRTIAGATINFNEVGHVFKITLPTDYSSACISGLAPGTNSQDVVNILSKYGFNVTIDCIRIPESTLPLQPKAIVTVEDPLFATELAAKVKSLDPILSISPIPISSQQANCRKVYISWHKSTRSAWMNFGSGDIANRVAKRFNEGKFKCMGRYIKSSAGKSSLSQGVRFNYNPPRAWTITLSDIPKDATVKDVEKSISSPHDQPRHTELSRVSYQASDVEVSVIVRSELEKHGPLDNFYLGLSNKGKRTKATALFSDEADAKSACSLDNASLDILGSGKLTVSIIQSAKIKVPTAIFEATRCEIDSKSKAWKERHVVLHIYSDTIKRFTTLKLESNSVQDVASARKALDMILSGSILKIEDNPLWHLALNSNGSTYRKVKLIEKELQILIIRDRQKRQLQYYGPGDKLQQTAEQVADIIKEETSSHGIQIQRDSTPQIEQVHPTTILDSVSLTDGMCPICFDDDPETPIQTLCEHTYCFNCFEDLCKFAASTSRANFQVVCHGNEGDCEEVLKLAEIQNHLSSATFEIVLKSSFEEYVKRHPNEFFYCPTTDCGYIRRCAPVSGEKPVAYTCPNCLEPICNKCQAMHGSYSCAEYKDIASGGYEALEKLKRELNIKDCPKCKTSLEKISGCNHMTCRTCQSHICWVCMAVFAISEPCYEHMRQVHGGIGLEELNRFMDEDF